MFRVDEVDEAVGRPDEVARPLHDRPEEVRRVEPVHQHDRGLVERRQVGVGELVRRLPGRRPVGRLGQVEVCVGRPNQRLLRPPVVRERGDPDADRHRRARRADLGRRRLADGGADPAGDRLGLGVPEAGQDDRELVAPVAIGAVAVPEGAPDRLRDRPQERVAGRVPARVVERLEAVEVHHQDRQPAGVVRRDGLAELGLEGAVVAQPGQRVQVGADAHGAVRLGVLEGDRGLPGEQLRQLELVRG